MLWLMLELGAGGGRQHSAQGSVKDRARLRLSTLSSRVANSSSMTPWAMEAVQLPDGRRLSCMVVPSPQ